MSPKLSATAAAAVSKAAKPTTVAAAATIQPLLLALAAAVVSFVAFFGHSSLANPILRQQSSALADASSELSTNELRTPNAAANSQQQHNKCLSGWMWFNNKCWVTTTSRRDWQHSIELCKRLYGESTLPTIHSEEENEFLKNNVDLHNSPIWLYARHNHQYNNTRWMDSSRVNYTRWDAGQPTEKSSMVCIKTEDNWYMRKTDPTNGNSECVSFWEDAKWSTSVGCNVLLPVVCEMKLSTLARQQNQVGGGGSSDVGDANLRVPSESLVSSALTRTSPIDSLMLCTCATLASLLTYKLGALTANTNLLH